MQLLIVSLNAPDAHTHAHTHVWHHFSYLPIHKRETCTGLPSSGRTSHSTSDFRTHMRLAKEMGGGGGGCVGGLRGGVHGPRLNQATGLFFSVRRDSNTLKQAAKELNPCCFSCSPPHTHPDSRRHQTASVKQPALS